MRAKQNPFILPAMSLTFILIIASLWDLHTGQIQISLQQIAALLFVDRYSDQQTIAIAFHSIRLPRLLAALLSGALFGASGCILQSVMRNPMAAPDIVGVTAGGALAAVIGLILFPTLSIIHVAWMATVGACIGFGLTYLLAKKNGVVSPTRLAVTGVAIGACLLAAEHFLLLIAPLGIASSLDFIAGTVYGVNWQRVNQLWPIAIVTLAASLTLGRHLDLLMLNDESAIGLGVHVERNRLIALIFAVLLSGIGLAFAGILGFVGLVAPQIAYLLVGPRHSKRLPTAMLVGAILVVSADTLGRSIVSPLEIPAGIITTLIGAPYFLWLLARKR